MSEIYIIDDEGEVQVQGTADWYLGDTYEDSFLRVHIENTKDPQETMILKDGTLEIHLEVPELIGLTVSLLGAVVEAGTSKKLTMEDVTNYINEYVANHQRPGISAAQVPRPGSVRHEDLAPEDRTQ